MRYAESVRLDYGIGSGAASASLRRWPENSESRSLHIAPLGDFRQRPVRASLGASSPSKRWALARCLRCPLFGEGVEIPLISTDIDSTTCWLLLFGPRFERIEARATLRPPIFAVNSRYG